MNERKRYYLQELISKFLVKNLSIVSFSEVDPSGTGAISILGMGVELTPGLIVAVSFAGVGGTHYILSRDYWHRLYPYNQLEG